MSKSDNNSNNKGHEFRRKVAQQLQAERWIKEITQQEMADRLSTSKSTISRIEKGDQNITLDYLGDYADALGMEAVVTLHEPAVEYE